MNRFGAAALVCVLLGLPVRADFKAGMEAYERGDYEAARREWEPQDFAEAHGWYLKAAEGGYARAQYRVAEMFENGEGIRKDLIQAHYWFGRAGAQKYSDAKKRRRRVADKMTPEQIAFAELKMRQHKRREKATD
jgi:TPR repeat protein